MPKGRLLLWIPLTVAWGAALGALYIHAAFWVLFGAVLSGTIFWRVRNWKTDL